jgi:endoglucanase
VRTLRGNGLRIAIVGVVAICTVVGILLIIGTPHQKVVETRPWPDSATNTQIYPGGLWVNPSSLPATEARQLRSSGQTTAAGAVATIAAQPIATWLTESASAAHLKAQLTQARAAGTTPVFVTYAIPDRDCGDYSAGGFRDNPSYERWNATIAAELRGHRAIVLIEPDSIAMLGRPGCSGEGSTRLAVLKSVVRRYARNHIDVYLDGGNSHWQSPATMAARLRQAGVRYARGFFTNVSNFYRVDQERSYANRLSELVGDKHFVIDVSRNGAGWKGAWCNPAGAALGQDPHVTAGATRLDALLWVKTPGVSDGTCNGGPPAGEWFESYALALVGHRAR